MKQVVQNFRNGKLSLDEVPPPALQEGGVLVNNHYSLVSAGTEKTVIEFAQQTLAGKAKSRPDLVKEVLNKIKTDGIWTTYKTVSNRLDTPLTLGYSTAGEVIAVGANAPGFALNDLVACAGGGYASHAEVVFVPKNLCVKVPDNVTPQEAAFTTLGAIALQGIRVLELTPGDRIVVLGLGLIGQLTVQLLNAYGYSVFGLDVNEEQLKSASRLGLKHGAVIGKDDVEKLVTSFSQGAGTDAVIITASTSSSDPVRLAGSLCRDKGKVSVVGDVGLDIPRNIYYAKELQLTVSRSYGPGRYDPVYEEKGIDYPIGYVRWTEKRNMEEFLRLLSRESVQVKPMITHIFKIEDALKAYNLILENPNNEVFSGILLEYGRTREIKPTITLRTQSGNKTAKDFINVGLIGAGNFASHIILPSLNRIPSANLRAIADIEGPKANAASRKTPCAYITSDYREILGDDAIDLVVVATRHDQHAAIASEALRKNKNVHLEKPLALNLAQLKEVIEAERSSEGRLMVGFNRRFSPHIVETKRFLEKVNTPLLMYSRVNAGYIPRDNWVHDPEVGGGRIVGEACHFIDLLLFLAESNPQRVFASKVQGREPVNEDDNVTMSIDFANGSRGLILYTSLGNRSAPKEYFEIFADEKVIVIDNFHSSRFFQKNTSRKIRGHKQDKGHLSEFRSFISAIIQGEPSPISMEDQILTTMTSFKVLDAIKTREPQHIDISEAFKPGTL